MKVIDNVTVKDVVQCYCDKCSKQLSIGNNRNPSTEILPDPVSLKYTFGYFSKMDMERIELDLCEDCFIELLGKDLLEKGIQNTKTN